MINTNSGILILIFNFLVIDLCSQRWQRQLFENVSNELYARMKRYDIGILIGVDFINSSFNIVKIEK
jgi:hypothetical protein